MHETSSPLLDQVLQLKEGPMRCGLSLIMIWASLILLTCSEDPVITDWRKAETPFVLSLLSPAFDRVEVYVGSSLPESEAKGMKGAKVIIEGPSGAVELRELGNGLYTDTNMPVRNEETYHLWIQTPTGKTLTAQTTVPGTFSILNISSGDTLHYLSTKEGITRPEVYWSPSAGAVVYLCLLQLRNPDLHTVPVTTLDTLSTLPSVWSSPIDTTQIRILDSKLAIYAFDSAFSRYQRGWIRVTNGLSLEVTPSVEEYFSSFQSLTIYQRSNIINGVGIFGSAAMETIDVVISFVQDR